MLQLIELMCTSVLQQSLEKTWGKNKYFFLLFVIKDNKGNGLKSQFSSEVLKESSQIIAKTICGSKLAVILKGPTVLTFPMARS